MLRRSCQNSLSFRRPPVRWTVLVIVLGLSVALAAATSVAMQLLWLSVLICVAIVLQVHDDPRIHDVLPEAIRNVFQLSTDTTLKDFHQQAVAEMVRISNFGDAIFQSLIGQQLQAVLRDLQSLGRGGIEYDSTEAWRVVYEELLRSPGLYRYRSVSHVETQNYWQDGPGRQSTLLNIELQQAGSVIVERIVIVAPHLWSATAELPEEPVLSWIDEQARAGIQMQLVRESQLTNERELVNDFGIYGHRAVGMQRIDTTGRTLRFLLSFNFDEVCRAEQYWQQLQLHAQDYSRSDNRHIVK